PKGSMRRLQMDESQMRSAENDDGHHDDDRRDGESNGQTPGMFGSKVVDSAYQQDEENRGEPDVLFRDAEVAHPIPAAHCRGHDKVRQQEQRAEHGQDTALFARRRIHPAAIGEMFADDSVIVANQTRQRANGDDDGKGSETSREERQAYDVRL